MTGGRQRKLLAVSHEGCVPCAAVKGEQALDAREGGAGGLHYWREKVEPALNPCARRVVG